MKSLFVIFGLLLTAQLSGATTFDPKVAALGQAFGQRYGAAAGDLGIPCDRATGQHVRRGTANAVACLDAYFRAEDSQQVKSFFGAVKELNARVTSQEPPAAVAQMNGIWINLSLVGARAIIH